MNGSSVVLDTNAALYLLNGNKSLAELIQGKRVYISFITEIELQSFHNLKQEELEAIKDFLADCHIIDINSEIKTGTVAIRKRYKLKLPDSIILATANYFELPFITFDKDFKKTHNKNILLFEL